MLPHHYSSHAAHRQFAGLPAAGSYPPVRLDPESPAARDLVESLDDAMFAAIGGNRRVLEAARELWLQAIERLGPELIDESREQYLRFAVDVTRRFEWNETRDAARAMVAIEIIELLTKG